MMRWKKVLIGIVLFLLLLIIGLGLLIGTSSGLHLILNSAARWVPGLQIQQVQGGWRDLTLRGVSYQMPGVTVAGDSLHLAVDTSCLKRRSLCINDISLEGINVVVDSTKLAPSTQQPEPESSPIGEISTPYPILLRQLVVNNLNVQLDGTQLTLGYFATGLEWQQRNLHLLPTRLENLFVKLPTPQQVAVDTAQQAVTQRITQSPQERQAQEAAEKLQQRTQAQQQAAEPALGEQMRALFAKPLLSLPEFRLPLDVQIDEFLAENLRVTGATEIDVNRAQLKANAKDNQIALQTFNLRAKQGQLFITGKADLKEQWPVDLRINSSLNIDPLKGEKAKLQLSGNLKQQASLTLNLSGPIKADLQAMAQPAVAELPLALTLTAPQLRWPLTGKPDIDVQNLDLKLRGKATDYQLGLHTSVLGQSIPATRVDMAGQGNVEQFNLDKLRLALLEGSVDLKAVVDWSKAISWRTELAINGINTRKFTPEWPTRLAGCVATRGSLYGDSWQLSVPTIDLQGQVKQNPLKISGSATGNSYQQWNIPGIELALGSNQLNLKGSLGKQLNLDATINAPHLDNALPGLGGVIKGNILARGTLEHPQLETQITGHGLRWQQLRLAALNLTGHINSAEQVSGNLGLTLQQLQQPGVEIRQLQLAARGNEQQHQLTLTINGKPVSGELALKGSFDSKQQRWQGALSQTHFTTPVGEVRLSRAMTLDYQNLKQTLTVGSHCWLNPNAEICLPEPMVAGAEGHARIQLRRFDLAMIRDFLPQGTQVAGRFEGDGRVNWSADGGLPTGNLSIIGHGVKVEQDVQGNKLPIAFERLNINAGLAKGAAQLQWLVKLVDNGQLSGNLKIDDPQQRRRLSGKVDIDNFSLAMLNPALMHGEQIQGILASHLRLGGSLQQPQVFGQTSLHGVKAVASQLPVELTRADLDMRFNGMSSTLQGLIQTRQGQLNLSGNADWRQLDNWRAHIAAKGERIRVTVPPMVRLDVSPDLTFDATPALFKLDGRVDVPWARIVVQQVPESAVGVSADEVMLDENLQPIKPKGSGVLINSNLIVHLGDDVRLSAFGLNARLAGDLKVAQDKTGLGLNGQINIPSGRFHAYGQDLVVRKGQLQFSGPPSQPYINMEAIRNPDATEDDVTAGIRVTGMADEPKVEIFSDPTMSQQEALSYLLRGQGLGNGDDSNALTSALVGLGVAQSGQVLGQIGETFGISELALDTTGVGDSQQVQVSGYVLPGLQVKYGVGLFDSLATLTLRYRLMPKLYLEAVSSVDQALDLLYQFQFD